MSCAVIHVHFRFITLHIFLDVNGDGLNELIVTLTDRVIRTYQWRSFSKSIDSIGYQGENLKRNTADELTKIKYCRRIGSFSQVGIWSANRRLRTFGQQPSTAHLIRDAIGRRDPQT